MSYVHTKLLGATARANMENCDPAPNGFAWPFREDVEGEIVAIWVHQAANYNRADCFLALVAPDGSIGQCLIENAKIPQESPDPIHERCAKLVCDMCANESGYWSPQERMFGQLMHAPADYDGDTNDLRRCRAEAIWVEFWPTEGP